MSMEKDDNVFLPSYCFILQKHTIFQGILWDFNDTTLFKITHHFMKH